MKIFKAPVNCVKCGSEIKPLLEEDYGMVDRGVVDNISAGYGSRYDGDVVQIGICDDCLDGLIKDKKVKLVYNYILGNCYD
jgi:hypothetical protein